MALMGKKAEDTREGALALTKSVPEEFWYWAAISSIGLSAIFKLNNKDDAALFVGQWPPTFLLFGLFSRLLRPSAK
ncbi:MAG TPA: hypothetical protein VGR16_05200 [Thermomicrobiales bacterium]|nr:hypothetical protein [Thermomicrobiales bacterium]